MYFVEVVDFVPDFIEAHKLDEDLLLLFDGIEISLCIILDLMDLFIDSFLNLGLFLPFFFMLEVLFDLLDVVVDVLGMVEFLNSEVSFEEGNLQPIAELYFLILDERALFVFTMEVAVAVDCTVVFSSIDFLPFHTYPQLSFAAGRLSLMDQGSEVSDGAC